MKKTCLVTGGLGYIGSHICIELIQNEWDLLILDNLSNCSINKLNQIIDRNNNGSGIIFFNIDLTDYDKFDKLIDEFILEYKQIDMVIHLAGLKAVGESIELPIKYYENNLTSTINLVKIMEKYSIKNLIFSSSATVYGSAIAPYFETTQTGIGITNPYGRSKFIQEEMLKDIQLSHKDWNTTLLRYFNPISHLNNNFKEDPNGIPNNLFPYLIKVNSGELKCLTIFGDDYGTRDGTCSRDFIHVVDLANAHLVCANAMLSNKIEGLKIYNVGTGIDTTVLELIKAFENQNKTKLNYKIGTKRHGDLETSYSNVELIFNELGWKSKYDITDCVKIN